METDRLIDDLRRTLDAQLVRLKALRELPLTLLERRPAPKRWSVLEVCEHLNLLSGHYLRHLERAYASGGFTRAARHRPGYWGGKLTRMMQPRPDGSVPRPMSTLWIFEPRKAPSKRLAALDECIAMVQRLRDVLDKAERDGLEGPRITSTLGPIFRFKAADAFSFATAHQERHLLQIDRTLAALR